MDKIKTYWDKFTTWFTTETPYTNGDDLLMLVVVLAIIFR